MGKYDPGDLPVDAARDSYELLRTIWEQLQRLGGLVGNQREVKKVDGDYEVQAEDEVVGVDAATASVTVTLPPAVPNIQRPLYIVKKDATPNKVEIAGVAGDTIGRPYFYGHSVMLNEWQSPATQIDGIIGKTNVKAIFARHLWRTMEPATSTEEEPVYDFSAIEAQIATLEAAGSPLKFVVFVQTRTFNPGQQVCPQWVIDAGLDIPYALGGGGHEPVYWDQRIEDALIRVHTAIYNQFKNRPNFAGTATTETAVGLDAGQVTTYGYTPEGMRDAMIGLLQGAALNCPNMRVFAYLNFIQGNNGYVTSIGEAVAAAPYRVAIGGPDILPENTSLTNTVYPNLRAIRNTVPDMYMFNSAQYNSYSHPDGGPFWTPKDLKDFAKDPANLGVHMIVWSNLPDPQEPGAFDIDDAYAMIATEPEAELDTYTGDKESSVNIELTQQYQAVHLFSDGEEWLKF